MSVLQLCVAKNFPCISDDFSSGTAGNPPPNWTSEKGTAGTIVRTAASHAQHSSAGDLEWMSWDSSSSEGDGLLTGRFHSSSDSLIIGYLICWDVSTPASDDGYLLRIRWGADDDIAIVRRDNGSGTTLDSDSFTLQDGFDYSIKFYKSGSTIKAKVWRDNDGEPGTWSLETTDSNYTSGQIGMLIYSDDANDSWIDDIEFCDAL
jgi:hypothetical protein